MKLDSQRTEQNRCPFLIKKISALFSFGFFHALFPEQDVAVMALTLPPARESPRAVCPGCVRDQGAEIPSSSVPCTWWGWLCTGAPGSWWSVLSVLSVLVFCSVTVVKNTEKCFFLKLMALRSEFHNAALARDSRRVQTHPCVSPVALRVCASAIAPGSSLSGVKEHMSLPSVCWGIFSDEGSLLTPLPEPLASLASTRGKACLGAARPREE